MRTTTSSVVVSASPARSSRAGLLLARLPPPAPSRRGPAEWHRSSPGRAAMANDVSELRSRALEPEVTDELDRFEQGVAQYLTGEIDDEAFRVFRLNQGIYGQRQGGHNQMLRVKIPHGRLEPEQLETLAYVAETYPPGWGHL